MKRHFRCFDTATEKLDEMWTGRPVGVWWWCVGDQI